MTLASRKPVAYSSDNPPAIELLLDEHRKVEKLFEHYADQDGTDIGAKEDLARRISRELIVHCAVKEALFYPVARQLLADDVLIANAMTRNSTIRNLVIRIVESSSADSHFDTLVESLDASFKHHVQEEETNLFPGLIGFKAELAQLAQEMVAMRAQMLGMVVPSGGGKFTPVAMKARPAASG